MTNTYLLGSKRLHMVTLGVISAIAAFLRWYRLDNCVFASGDEWLAIGPTFQFLEKFFRNPVTAIGYEALAGVPFWEIGRMGPPFDYTRSLALIWTMPYYGAVGLFDFPVSESWYRFPGTIWSLLALSATYFFIYQLTQRHVSALFGFALQATLIGHLVQSRFLVADGIFLFWFALAGGLWLQFLRNRQTRTRHWAYLATMFYASSTPEALIGITALFSLVVFWLWQEGQIDPFRRPVAMLGELRRIFLAYPLLWLLGFYGFQVLIELKFYLHDRPNFLNHANYLGRFFGRGGGELSFYPNRVLNWYIYPHISAPVLFASLFSLGFVPKRDWRASLAWGWLWVAFWITLTLLVSNSSSNFTRVMHAFLVLGAVGLTAVYDYRPSFGFGVGAVLIVANIWLVFDYPLLCSQPENRNTAQAVGYFVQSYEGDHQDIAFYYPTGALYIYVPEDDYFTVPIFEGEYTFEGCEAQQVQAASLANVEILLALPPDYDVRAGLNAILDYAVEYECEMQRNQALDDFARANRWHLAGRIISAEGEVHVNIWSRAEITLGDLSLEEANRLHYERYSRRSWFNY